jgi:hypothetical protein
MAQHNGAPKLYLAFDGEHTAAGDTVVSVRLAAGDPRPSVDGKDEGDAEWGNVSTTVALRKAAGDYNFIEEAEVRSVFDEDYIYFLVQWAEVANEVFGMEVGLSDEPAFIIYPPDSTSGNPTVWDIEQGNEDRLLMLFEISDVTRYDADGCMVTCHTADDVFETNYHATRSATEYMDVWMWGAGLTNPTGYLNDQYMTSSPSRNVITDIGMPVMISNVMIGKVENDTTTTVRPRNQSVDDPNSNSGYPLWTWELAPLSTSGWVGGSRIPAFISNSTPSNSAADVEALGSFDDQTGTWTVELKRQRRTGNGDDAQF